MNSIFTISLDFELHWGGFEKWTLDEEKKQYFLKTRELIPKMLALFEKYGVHVSWATVGLLMHENKEALSQTMPADRPSYQQQNLSAYQFMSEIGIGDDEEEDPFHYAHTLVAQIEGFKGQELASHSYAHYYCNEAGQTLAQFQSDCQAISSAAKNYGKELKSLVFPRNQFNEAYLSVCANEGIEIIRSNPVDWWWQISSTQNESLWRRLNRGLDAYFNIGGKTSYGLQDIKKRNGVYLLPASRLLRPFNPKEFVLNTKKINRIKKEMTLAAKNGEFYHLWWHPHNFGGFPSENMKGFIQLLEHYQYLNETYLMESLNMGEIANKLKSNAFE